MCPYISAGMMIVTGNSELNRLLQDKLLVLLND